MATTQFESVDARRSFPCFDEPDRKAVFEITLIVEPDLDAISNSPVVEIDQVGDKQRIRFAPTMKMSTYLVAVRRRQARDDRDRRRGRRAAPGRLHPREAPSGRVRPGGRRVRAALLHRVLQHPLPRRQGRPGGHSGLRRRGDGEPGLHHLPRHGAARRPGRGGPRRARACRRRHRPRAGAHVVRRPRDHGLVGGHLAQRGLRHLHGDALRRRLPAVVGPLDRLRTLPRGRPGRRRAPPDPSDRVPGRAAQRGRGHVRRADLREGLRRPAHARAAHRARGVPRRRADLPQGARLRQHGDQRPVGCARGRQRRTRARRDGHVHSAGRAPARLPARRHAQPATLRAGTGARRRDIVHRLGVARPRRRAGAALRRPARRAGAPPRPRCRTRGDRRGRTGPCRGERRRVGHLPGRLRDRAPDGARRAPPRAHPPGAGQPGRRHLGDHPRRPLDARGVPGPGLAARRRARARGLVPRRRGVAPHQAHRAGRSGGRAPPGGCRARRTHPAPTRLGRHTGRERPHADVARAGHQPSGDSRRRRRGPGRGGTALRRLPHRRRLR